MCRGRCRLLGLAPPSFTRSYHWEIIVLTALSKRAMACVVAACLLAACSGNHAGGGVTLNFCGVKMFFGGEVPYVSTLLTAPTSQISPTLNYYHVGPSCSEGGSVQVEPATGLSSFTVIARDSRKRPTVVQFAYSTDLTAKIVVTVGKAVRIINVPPKK